MKKVLILFLLPLFVFSQPLTNGQAIMTHWTDNNGWDDGYAISIFDTENNLSAPLGPTNWATNFYNPADPTAYDSWRGDNMGDVFGIAIDSDKNAYFTASTAIAGGSFSTITGVAGSGGVYIMDANTWLVTPFINTGTGENEMPNSEVGLGNICYDQWHDQLFITNFEDGKIYRFDMDGNLLSTYDPFELDDGSDGFAGLGEVSWGIELYGTNEENVKVYFAVWNYLENSSIWSIDLDINGEFYGEEEFCFQIPALSGSHPVSDLTFDSFGSMYLSEKTNSYAGDGYTIYGGAHNSRAFQYQEIDGVWTQTQQYLVGAYSIGNNTTGGVSLGNKNTEDGYECDQLAWFSGDCLGNPCSIYGAAGVPVDGNASIGADASSIYIDVPVQTVFADKQAFGDIEIWSECEGCTDELACNYDWWALVDDESCVYPEFFTVTNTINDVTCMGGNDGSIELLVTGPSTYTFVWTDSNGVVINEDTNILNNLSVGNYSVEISDDDCESDDGLEFTFSVEEANIILVSEIHSDYAGYGVSCNGICDGWIDLEVSGGTGVYTYEWSNGATLEDISNLCVGIYSAIITDENDCSVFIEVEITDPEVLVVSETHSDYTGYGVSCNGVCDGWIDLEVSGGSGNYTYEWSNGVDLEDLSDLCAGTYSVIVTDENGCNVSLLVELSNPEAMAISENSSNVSCNGASDGFIDIIVTGGTGVYMYEWSNGLALEDISNLDIGIYSVTVFDENGCSVSIEVEITEPEVLAVSEIHSDYTGYGVSCNGSTDGFIDITVTGGTGLYIYDWSNGDSSEDVTDLGVGTYLVTVTDENWCTVSIEVEITEPEAIVVLETHSDYTGYGVSCNGACDGWIDLEVSGGDGDYTYEWSVNNFYGSTLEDISDLCAGIYVLLVTDERGCSVSIEIEIIEPEELEISLLNFTNISCFDGSDGSINIDVSGGSAGYTYEWSTGQTSQDVSGLSIGTYYVQVYDNNGCIDNFYYELTQPDPLEVNYIFNNSECGLDNGNINVTTTGGTPPYSYFWSNGETIESVNLLAPGSYSVIVTDSNGCNLDVSQDIVDIQTPPSLLAGNVDECELTSYLHAYTLDYNAGPWEYIWGSSDNVIIDDPFSLTTSVTVPEYGIYAFQYSACETSDTVSVTFSCPVIIPNTLTVNGDGNNDLFIIQNLTSELYSQSILTIYNRWGRIVYIDPSYGLGVDINWWDGKAIYHDKPFSSISLDRDIEASKLKTVSDGVYYYTLELFHKGVQVKNHHTGYIYITR